MHGSRNLTQFPCPEELWGRWRLRAGLGHSDPRYLIQGHPANLYRDLYFAIYQTLWSPDEQGTRLFERFPPQFFDLVIIDECHRSGFGTWREILDRFGAAIHLGMTATPKQDENVDTYAYFCAEEPEVAIDPDDLTWGTWRPPAYQYSLGQGIDDGFLATYKVHRVRTTLDANGLHLQDVIEQGAEVFIPEAVEPRPLYTTPHFEREITLPDRTRAMVRHLATLLRRYGAMDKTMVFCVDMEHARLVARLLQDEFGPETGLDNYTVPIISEEGEEGRRWLEDLADSDLSRLSGAAAGSTLPPTNTGFASSASPAQATCSTSGIARPARRLSRRKAH